MGLFDFDFGGMGNSLGSMGGQMPIGMGMGQKAPLGAWDTPPGKIGGPNTGGKSQSQGAPGQFQQPQPIPNAAGYFGRTGTQSGQEQQSRIPMADRIYIWTSMDALGFPLPKSQGGGGPQVRSIPTNIQSMRANRLKNLPPGRIQQMSDSGSSVGEDMNQPMMGDLQQSPIKGQQQGRMSFMDTLAKIESQGGTNTRNLISPSHVGKYQMSQSAFKRFSSGGDINDPTAQAAAAQNMANYNRTSLKQLTGRDPTDAEVFLSYNQGLHGAWQLLSNPDKPAGSLVKPQNIMNQGGDPRAPASNFINMMTLRWNDAAGGAQTMGATRGVNQDAFAPPAQRFTNKGAQQTGSKEQLLQDMNRDAAAASQLRSPPDMGDMQGQ